MPHAHGLEVRDFDSPDERREFGDKGYVLVLTLAGREIGKSVFQPG